MHYDLLETISIDCEPCIWSASPCYWDCEHSAIRLMAWCYVKKDCHTHHILLKDTHLWDISFFIIWFIICQRLHGPYLTERRHFFSYHMGKGVVIEFRVHRWHIFRLIILTQPKVKSRKCLLYKLILEDTRNISHIIEDTQMISVSKEVNFCEPANLFGISHTIMGKTLMNSALMIKS